jgi:hypothetical protein
MDVEVRRAFWVSMREFTARGRTVLFATHYLDEADQVADRIVTVWLASLPLIWVGLIPLTILGIAIGVWVKAEAVQGLTTMTLLVLSLLGGMWFRVDIMPAVMKSVAHTLPSYWLAELGRYPFLPGEAFPWDGGLGAAGLVGGADGARCAGLSSSCRHEQALTAPKLRGADQACVRGPAAAGSRHRRGRPGRRRLQHRGSGGRV